MARGLTLGSRRAVVQLGVAALVALSCCALVVGAALAPAPPVVLPLLAVVCVGLPMAVAVEVPGAVRMLRRETRALAALRRHLAELPETPHPLED